MTAIWGVVLISAIGALVVLMILLVAFCVGVHQEAERLTGRAPTRLAATARRVTGLHVITAPPALLRDVQPLGRIQAGPRAPTPIEVVGWLLGRQDTPSDG